MFNTIGQLFYAIQGYLDTELVIEGYTFSFSDILYSICMILIALTVIRFIIRLGG